MHHRVRKLARSHLDLLLAAPIIAVAFFCAFLHLRGDNFLPCAYECGETLIAEFDARNVRLFGLRYGLVEDLATSPVPDAHPQYYTHNVNLGGLSFIAMELLGLKFAAKQFVILMIWALGLFYAYRCIAYFSRSRLCGLVMLLFLATDFPFSLAYSAHGLRTWQWLPLFGLPLHVDRYFRNGTHADAAWALLLFLISFGVGYDYWLIMLAVAGCFFAYAVSQSLAEYASLIRRGALVFGLALVPFILRQIHIIAVLGFDYWKVDFLSTIAIKIPFVSRIIKIPPIETLDAWYQQHNVMRPPAAPVTPEAFLTFLNTAKRALLHVTLPSAGLLTVTATLIAALAGAGLIAARLVSRPSAARPPDGPFDFDPEGLCAYVACMCAAIAVGIALTPTVAVQYILYNPPLIVAPLFATKALLVALLLRGAWWAVSERRRWVSALAGVGIILVAIDHIVVSQSERRHIKPMDTSWLPVVQAMPDATFAASYIPQSIAAFTRNWAIHVGGTGLAHTYFPKVAAGEQPFTTRDLFFFGERDRDTVDYTRPDYWLYFTVDRRIHIFDPEPECRLDYATTLLRKVRQTLNPAELRAAVSVQPQRVRPGAQVLIAGSIDVPFELVQSIELQDGIASRQMSYNCITKSFSGVYRLPENWTSGTAKLRVVLNSPAGQSQLAEQTIAVDANAPMSEFAPPTVRQPSVANVLNTYGRRLPVVAARRGISEHEGFILINLRALHN